MSELHPPPLSVTDMALLGQLWEECRHRLLAMLRRRIDPSLAARVDPEEVLSQTFLDASSDWPRYRAQTAITGYAWLYRLALDRLIETWRKESRDCRDVRRAMPWPDESSVLLGMNLADSATSPSAAAVREELRERMRQVLGKLCDADRDVLWMRHADQLPFAEVGHVLGVSENAATVRYVRALKKLRGLWEAANSTGGPK